MPLLIPDDTLAAVQKLLDLRTEIGINSENVYVFPYTQHSLEHVIGWHEMGRVSLEAGVQNTKLFTANKVRHRAATAHALAGRTDIEKEAFFRHMGHSKMLMKRSINALWD